MFFKDVPIFGNLSQTYLSGKLLPNFYSMKVTRD